MSRDSRITPARTATIITQIGMPSRLRTNASGIATVTSYTYHTTNSDYNGLTNRMTSDTADVAGKFSLLIQQFLFFLKWTIYLHHVHYQHDIHMTVTTNDKPLQCNVTWQSTIPHCKNVWIRLVQTPNHDMWCALYWADVEICLWHTVIPTRSTHWHIAHPPHPYGQVGNSHYLWFMFTSHFSLLLV